jgi:hypothetical protein
MTSRRSIPLLLACLAAVPAAAQPFDAYEPASLVARARQAMREGEMRDACVLISRAGQLAPHDVRVSLAWGDYEAAQRGMPVPEAAPPPVAPAATRASAPKPLEVAPEPPAPWPAP